MRGDKGEIAGFILGSLTNIAISVVTVFLLYAVATRAYQAGFDYAQKSASGEILDAENIKSEIHRHIDKKN
ncbi:hypothetical protein AGMMS49975_07940 [Clostridia bacterium]|nr:hypothetical protein AGMMS49975_07940 [Clostridia bacterium]